MRNAILIENLNKKYQNHLAVHDLSLAVPAGSIYGVLGPNGAGKTTTLRMLLDIISRDSGNIAMLGIDPATDRKVLTRVGYLPEERGLYRKMRVLDAVVFFARLKGVGFQQARKAAKQWIDNLGLGDWQQAKVESLSKGMQQKVQFIASIIHEPELLILDEPTSGLDPVNQQVMCDAIKAAQAAGRTVLLSTHNLEQAEELCESLCIVAQGQKLLDGQLRDIRRAYGGKRYRVRFENEPNLLAAALGAHNGLLDQLLRVGDQWEFAIGAQANVHEVLAFLNSLQAPITCFEHIQPSLRDIFVQQVSERAQPAMIANG